MNNQLRSDREHRVDILRRALALAEQYYSRQDSMPPGIFVPDIEAHQLPNEGAGAMATLDLFEKEYARLITNSAGPRYFGFVTGGSTPASVAGDWLVSAYDQNTCGSNDSIAPQIEKQTIDYFRQLFGISENFYGSFVTGATMANFVGLALGRQWLGEQLGRDVASDGLTNLPITIVSGTPHSSVLKSLSMLGIGRNAVHKVDTLPGREAIDIQKLEQYLATARHPVIVVANAGTVTTGDFDDLREIAALKNKYKFWLHVDGAFGGFAACSEKFKYLTDGVEEADSLTVDAHKWLNVPYDSAMQFTRHRALQLKIFQNSAAYLSDPAKSGDYFHYTPESSRRWRALPAWFSLRAYGKNGYREIIERNCFLAVKLGRLIGESDEFKLLSVVRLNIVCFTFKDSGPDTERIQTFLHRVREDGKVFFTPTVYKGTPAIRAAVSNWQTADEDIDIAFKVITRIVSELKQETAEYKTI